MYFTERFYRRKRFWIRFILIGLAVLFVWAFRAEIRTLIDFQIFVIRIGLDLPASLPPRDQLARALIIMAFNLILGFMLMFAIWLGLISHQALLPTRTLQEMHRTIWNLLLYIFGMHGPAVFVRDGQIRGSDEETKRNGPGVAAASFNNAIVLEEKVGGKSFWGPLFGLLQDFLLVDLDFSDPYTSPRVKGRGLVFTRQHEAIKGVVDLRKQIRIQPGVLGYTRDGIEVSTRVSTLFTVGQDPDVLLVTYQGGQTADNLRVVSLRLNDETSVDITGFSDDLDDADKAEIHQWVQQTPLTGPAAPAGPLWFNQPQWGFQFDPDRVMAAVFSEAREGPDSTPSPWQDLPVRVSIATFREMLTHYDYNELYQPGDSPDLPVNRLYRQLRLVVRNLGILSFQFVADKAGYELAKGIYPKWRLVAYEPQTLTNPKILRQRGIKILSAGFGDLTPVSPAVYEQRLDSWRASWEANAEVVKASMELEAMRVRNHARAEAQRDMTYALSQIMQNPEITRAALAWRVFQALENAAADAKTRQLLPNDTINLLRNLHGWLSDQGNLPPPPAAGYLP